MIIADFKCFMSISVENFVFYLYKMLSFSIKILHSINKVSREDHLLQKKDTDYFIMKKIKKRHYDSFRGIYYERKFNQPPNCTKDQV